MFILFYNSKSKTSKKMHSPSKKLQFLRSTTWNDPCTLAYDIITLKGQSSLSHSKFSHSFSLSLSLGHPTSIQQKHDLWHIFLPCYDANFAAKCHVCIMFSKTLFCQTLIITHSWLVIDFVGFNSLQQLKHPNTVNLHFRITSSDLAQTLSLNNFLTRQSHWQLTKSVRAVDTFSTRLTVAEL